MNLATSRLLGLLASTVCALMACATIGQVSQPQPQEPPSPEDVSNSGDARRVMLFESLDQPTTEIQALLDDAEFDRVPLLTKRYYFNETTQRFDVKKFERMIWPRDTALRNNAIPPGYSGWAILDFEEWDPIRNPEKYTRQEVLNRVQDYKDLIAATRRLRPNTKFVLHNFSIPAGQRRIPEFVEEITRLCDGTSPAMWITDLNRVDQQLRVLQRRLDYSLLMKKKYGLKVIPVIGKRTVTRTPEGQRVQSLMPIDVFRRVAEFALTYEHQGEGVDGLILWSNDYVVLHRHAGTRSHPDTKTQADIDRSDEAAIGAILSVVEEIEGKPRIVETGE